MSKFKSETTPDQMLLNAVNKGKWANTNKIRDAIAAGANVNAQDASGMTSLDIIAKKVKSYGMISLLKTVTTDMRILSSVWNELVANGGALNIYKDDYTCNHGLTMRVQPNVFSKVREIKFDAPTGSIYASTFNTSSSPTYPAASSRTTSTAKKPSTSLTTAQIRAKIAENERAAKAARAKPKYH